MRPRLAAHPLAGPKTRPVQGALARGEKRRSTKVPWQPAASLNGSATASASLPTPTAWAGAPRGPTTAMNCASQMTTPQPAARTARRASHRPVEPPRAWQGSAASLAPRGSCSTLVNASTLKPSHQGGVPRGPTTATSCASRTTIPTRVATAARSAPRIPSSPTGCASAKQVLAASPRRESVAPGSRSLVIHPPKSTRRLTAALATSALDSARLRV